MVRIWSVGLSCLGVNLDKLSNFSVLYLSVLTINLVFFVCFGFGGIVLRSPVEKIHSYFYNNS